MRIAVAGATGNIGGLTVSALEDAGHDVMRISRSLGVDLTTGVGLDHAVTGVDAVIDTTNSTVADAEGSIRHFADHDRQPARRRATGGRPPPRTALHRRRRPCPRECALRREARAGTPGHRRPGPLDHRASDAVPRLRRDGGRLVRDGRRGGDPASARPARRPVRRGGRVGRGRRRATTPALRRRGRPGSAGPGGHGAAHVRSTRPRGDAAADVVRGVRSRMAGDVLLPGPGARIMPTTFEAWLDGSRSQATDSH